MDDIKSNAADAAQAVRDGAADAAAKPEHEKIVAAVAERAAVKAVDSLPVPEAAAAADFAADPAEVVAEKAPPAAPAAAPAASAAKDGPKAPEAAKDASAPAAEPEAEYREPVESQDHEDHPSRLRPAARPAPQGP